MKGLILAGGKGTRLQPVTYVVNKHMVPIINRPMILYPLETLKHLGCTDIMIVSGGGHIGGIAEFLGDGSQYGVSLTYRVQRDAGGIAQALALAKDFVDGHSVAVILGDNIYENKKLPKLPKSAGVDTAYLVLARKNNLMRYGVPVFKNDRIVTIEEKPKKPKSQFAVTGLYIYPHNVFDIISKMKPSARGELEITDVNNWYIQNKKCDFTVFKGFWSDAGTRESLKEAIDWAFRA